MVRHDIIISVMCYITVQCGKVATLNVLYYINIFNIMCYISAPQKGLHPTAHSRQHERLCVMFSLLK